MTVVLRDPLTPRRFKWIVAIVLLVTAVGIPATLYWVLQRSDMRLRWDLEARYAQEFYFQSDYAAGLLKGDVTPPTNITMGLHRTSWQEPLTNSTISDISTLLIS